MNSRKGRIFGIPNRYYVLAFIILGFLAARVYPPVLPHIQVSAERFSSTPLFTLPVIGEFYLTNTMTAMVIVDIILVLIALGVRKAATSGSLIPKGFTGAVEALLEVIYNLTEPTAGKWSKAIFPYFATIMLLVLVANWMELFPGVDSIGILTPSAEHGHATQEILPGVKTIIEQADGVHATGEQFALIPFVRVLSTDLNFTVALAVTAIFMVQVMGVRAHGIGYFTKFINIKGFKNSPIFGVIDFGVGLLEMVSEISKILSFSFRLFGNIFAGSVLLFVIGTLVPVLVQSLFLILEFFVGLLQALVFGMITMVFMSQAVAGHGEHSEEHAH